MFPGPLGASLAGRALERGDLGALEATNIRDFATDKHRSVDDTPAGGGAGMVLRPDVLAAALDSVADGRPMLALTPRGAPLTQERVRELAAGEGVILLCGRFEGFDERIFEARRARTGLDRRLCAVRRRARRDGDPRRLREAASRGNGRGLQRRGRELRRRGFSNIRTIPDLLHGKGARSPKCCDRGIMRRSRRGDMTKAVEDTRLRRPDLIERHGGASQAPPSGARRGH